MPCALVAFGFLNVVSIAHAESEKSSSAANQLAGETIQPAAPATDEAVVPTAPAAKDEVQAPVSAQGAETQSVSSPPGEEVQLANPPPDAPGAAKATAKSDEASRLVETCNELIRASLNEAARECLIGIIRKYPDTTEAANAADALAALVARPDESADMIAPATVTEQKTKAEKGLPPPAQGRMRSYARTSSMNSCLSASSALGAGVVGVVLGGLAGGALALGLPQSDGEYDELVAVVLLPIFIVGGASIGGALGSNIGSSIAMGIALGAPDRCAVGPLSLF